MLSKDVTRQPYRDGYLHGAALLTTDTGLHPADVLAASSSPQLPPVEEAAQPLATPEPAPQPTPEPEPVYFTYIVQEGDTVASIAARFGLQIESLLWNNAELRTDPDLILVGEELTVPTRDGILYTLKLGDTLSDIAELYQVEVENIAGLRSNEIGDPDSVLEGAFLLLPGAVPPPPPPPAATPEPIFAAAAPEEGSAGGDLAPSPPAAVVSGFIWPVVGPVNDYFGAPRGGGSYHSGIDIGLYGGEGSPIVAATPGQVVLASSGYGYGNYVVIRHDNGYETLYAHLSAIYVVQGQWVAQGEVIGAAGCSGWCTGTHLHFEVRVGGVPVDPLDYLP